MIRGCMKIDFDVKRYYQRNKPKHRYAFYFYSYEVTKEGHLLIAADHEALLTATERARDWISEDRGRPTKDHLD